MNTGRIPVFAALVTIVALAIFVEWMMLKGTLPVSLVLTTFGILGLSFLLTAIGGLAEWPGRAADNTMVAGILFFVLGIALSVALWARSGLPGAH